MIDFQEHMGKNPKTNNTQELHQCKYAATERTTKALNTLNYNGTTKTIEELDKLCQTL